MGQSIIELEIIIINDGSTDTTRSVAQSYARHDDRVIYIEQRNLGLSAARNAGIRRSCGKYIQFLDADDLLEFDKLSFHSRYLDGQPDADIVYGQARYFDSDELDQRRFNRRDNDSDEPWMPKCSGSGRTILSHLVHANIMPVNCPLVRASVFGDVGLFDETLRAVEDWDLWIRCAAFGKQFYYLDQPGTLALVRVHPTSMSADPRRLEEATFTLRLRAGKYLRWADLRIRNWHEGVALIKKLDLQPRNLSLWSLARANRTPSTLVRALLEIVDRNGIIRQTGHRTIGRASSIANRLLSSWAVVTLADLLP